MYFVIVFIFDFSYNSFIVLKWEGGSVIDLMEKMKCIRE